MRSRPEGIVLAANQHQPAANVFYRYHDSIRQFCVVLRIAEQTLRGKQVAGALCLLLHHLPILRMLIGIRHIRQRLAAPCQHGFALYRPLRTAIPFFLREALQHKITGRDGNCKSDFWEARGGNQRGNRCNGSTEDPDFSAVLSFQKVNGLLSALKRKAVIAQAVLRPDAQSADTFFRKPLCRTLCQHITSAAAQQQNDRRLSLCALQIVLLQTHIGAPAFLI